MNADDHSSLFDRSNENWRWACDGERCLCGRQALVVRNDALFGPTGDCAREEAHPPEAELCRFCDNAIDHARYWVAEAAAGRDAAPPEGEPQAGRCPQYRLRPDTTAVPPITGDSVHAFDPELDRRDRAPHRLQAELIAICEDAFASTMSRTVGRLAAHELSLRCHELSATVLDALAQGDDGEAAVHTMLLGLGRLLLDMGAPPAGVDLTGPHALRLVAEDWSETALLDRPLLVARRGVRRVLTPDAPSRLYRTWWA